MIAKLVNVDFQMLTLNATSVGSIIATAISENSTNLAVGFLIITVGILNLAKAYVTVRGDKKEQNKSKK